MTISRRGMLGTMAALAAGGGGVRAAGPDPATIASCESLAGTRFTGAERRQMAQTLPDMAERWRLLRLNALDNAGAAPATLFEPRLPGWRPRATPGRPARPVLPPLPATDEDLAFAPAWAQARWIAAGTLTSRRLTDLYLDRIAARAGRLNCIATLVADRARATADLRDREQRAGRRRGPLHGLPYGCKDLVDTAGIVTGWGAEPYRTVVPGHDAAIVTRLAAAGAVLIAKTSCGALAYGDLWYGGRTRNPWNIAQGSSGSSAGSAAAVADGLCSFAIGTETMGSIVSPAARCGTAGLRPTFGRVPRTGVMTLAWSYDKIGTLARTAADTALVTAALAGPDGADPAAIDLPWPAAPRLHPADVTLGYRPEWFEAAPAPARAALAALRARGVRLVPVTMPATDPALLAGLVTIEAAAAFEPFTLGDLDDLLGWQEDAAWPNSWRAARFEPAIGYVQAQRHRRRMMAEFADTLAPVDAIVAPAGTGGLTAIGNHTGCPAISLPCGLGGSPPTPVNLTLTGHLFDEPRLTAIATLVEEAVAFTARPPQ